ncbi:MAG TPA: hypothetical protein VNG12_17870 [Acidimicrobiales bacterium]|nr:hypothetical protein [Acidimicrobiales bacterium]
MAGGDQEGLLAGDYLISPAGLISIALLLINDHWLKGHVPGLVTGKLSDVAGLVFFPMVLVAATELFAVGRRPSETRRRTFSWLAVAVTGLAFALIKFLPQMALVYGDALGWARWLIFGPYHLVTESGMGGAHRVLVTHDLTDLWALPALGLSYLAINSRSVRRIGGGAAGASFR